MDSKYELCKRMHAAGLDHAWRPTDEVWYCPEATCPRQVTFPVPSGVIWCPRVGDMIDALGDELAYIFWERAGDDRHLTGIKDVTLWQKGSHSDHDLWLALCRAWLSINEQAKPKPDDRTCPFCGGRLVGVHVSAEDDYIIHYTCSACKTQYRRHEWPEADGSLGVGYSQEAKPEPVKLPNNWMWGNPYMTCMEVKAAKRPFPPRHDKTPPVDSAVNQPDLVNPYPWADDVRLEGGLIITDSFPSEPVIVTRVDGTSVWFVRESFGHEAWQSLSRCRPATHAFAIGDRVRVVSLDATKADHNYVSELDSCVGQDGILEHHTPPGLYYQYEPTGERWGVTFGDGSRWAFAPADLLYLPPSAPVPKYAIGDWLLKGSTAGQVTAVRLNQALEKPSRVVPVAYEVEIPNGPVWMRPTTGYWAENDVTLIGGAK